MGIGTRIARDFDRIASQKRSVAGMSYNPNMLILAVDTGGPCGGAALLRDETVLAQCGGRSEEGYSARIFRNVEEVLGVGGTRLAEVELFAVAAGPGSFTGLRVGLTAVKAWAEVWGRPIAPVDGLEAVAALATEPGEFVAPVIDARRGQVYAAIYRRGAGREAG